MKLFFSSGEYLAKDTNKNSVRLANTLLKDRESARDSHVLACNFARYLPV